ncbi:AbrB/MazE/SpoVT family DNA-binding domain-containing protein [Methylocapsa sp. S129]|uniref:AbrB/MazE/SpoVT family DNA-binding domain-containing protein n=1 Tax=Methylocapsa sp. S129 TaxID=1641869 RepID=UPI00131B8081|nr:AbrB/MazE/SpoVT family DNA-binding domain-containing protein [Methylocapsa sp. S129]
MLTLKLTAIGASTGVIIPKEMLARMNLSKGDSLYAVEAPDGSYRLTPYDPGFARKMEKADDIMRRYRNALHVLAQ